MVGFALAQAVPLLATPLLARLFTPEAFGLQTFFVSLASVLLIASTLRLDLAVVLAADEQEAHDIVALALFQTAIVATLTLAVILSFGGQIAQAFGSKAISAGDNVFWAMILVPMVLAMALLQLVSGLLTWRKQFGPIARAQVLNQVTYVGVAITLGLVLAPAIGLIGAKLAGQLCAALMIAWVVRTTWRNLRLAPPSVRSTLWRKCRPFIIFNAPYSAVATLGREVPILAFAAMSASAPAGFYGLTRTLLGAPATLLAASLSQVFYREAAEHSGTDRLRQLTTAILGASMTFTAPAIAFLLVWGSDAFAFAFGKEWRTAGNFAVILAVPAWLAMQTSWPERLFEASGRQGTSFAIQIGFDGFAFATVLGAAALGRSPVEIVTIFAVVNSAFHCVYLIGLFAVAGFGAQALIPVVARGLLILGASVAAMAALRVLPGNAGLVSAAVCAGMACAALALHGFRDIRTVSAGA